MNCKILVYASLFLCATAGLMGCLTDDDRTRSTLQASGFSNVQPQGYSFFGCGDDDTFSTKFTATNPAGQQVSGVVCCGIGKGCTVRF